MKLHPISNKGKLALVLTASATIIGFINIKSTSTTATIGLSAENQQVRTILGHSVWIYAVAISPDGQTLVSASYDKTIKLWNLHTGKLLHTLKGHGDAVVSIAISPDGKLLASGSWDKRIKLWNLQTGELLRTFKGHSDQVEAVAFSPNGKTLATGSYDKTVKLWNLETGEILHTLNHSASVRTIAFSPDGQKLASGTEDGRISLWQPSTGDLKIPLAAHNQAVRSVAFSPDGQTLASGSYDQAIKLWNLQTGQLLNTLAGHNNAVWSVAFSPDSQTLASSSYDRTIKLWYVQSGQLLRTLVGHNQTVWSVAFSPDGKTLASVSADETIKLWSMSAVNKTLPKPKPSQQPLETLPTSTANSIHVKKIEFIGNKILSSFQINTIIEPLHGRAVSFAQLQEVANQITQLYHNYGYTNFKGIIQKQNLNDGIIEIHIIEESYLCNGNTYDCSTLRLMLQQAVKVENWNRAIEIVDKLIQASPQEAQQLREYKTQLQNRLSKTSTSTTQK